MDVRKQIIMEFCEENFEFFQEWLESRDIESTEAECILSALEEDNG